MGEGGDEEGDDGGEGPREVVLGRAVDVPPEEVVDGYVPLAGEFEPVARVPPVGVELAVREACRVSAQLLVATRDGMLTRQLGKGAEDVLEDDEKGQ